MFQSLFPCPNRPPWQVLPLAVSIHLISAPCRVPVVPSGLFTFMSRSSFRQPRPSLFSVEGRKLISRRLECISIPWRASPPTLTHPQAACVVPPRPVCLPRTGRGGVVLRTFCMSVCLFLSDMKQCGCIKSFTTCAQWNTNAINLYARIGNEVGLR